MHPVEVIDFIDLTPHMRRIRVRGDFLHHLKLDFPGQWMKVFFPTPEGIKPHGRAYTIRFHDAEQGTLDFDFVLHGDNGRASKWASEVQLGEILMIAGPRDGYDIDQAATHHLLIGDSTALPAICDILDTLPVDAAGWLLLEANEIGEQSLVSRKDGFVAHINVSSEPWACRTQKLIETLKGIDLPASTQVFAAGEASMVRAVRQLLTSGSNTYRSVSVSGYWRVGTEDHRDTD